MKLFALIWNESRSLDAFAQVLGITKRQARNRAASFRRAGRANLKKFCKRSCYRLPKVEVRVQ